MARPARRPLAALAVAAALLPGTLPLALAATKAFPTAEGYGAGAIGGRGGAVHHVTTLADSGAGSLRACIEASGPRTCIFRIAGIITLQTGLRITNPFITIAGQSAPGGGVLLRNAPSNDATPLDVRASDVVIRHLRLRPGPSDAPTCCLDALNIYRGAERVIVDHVSASWSVDGTLDIAGGHDVTIQWSIITEPLNDSTHKKGPHAYTALFSSATGDVTFHHNLIGYGVRRNPMLAGTMGVADIVNNVVYNPKSHALYVTDDGGDQQANVVGNYLQPGPDTPDGTHLIEVREPRDGHSHSIYIAGNYDPLHRAVNTQAEDRVMPPNDRRYAVSVRHPAPAVTTTGAAQAFEDVLARAGATLPLRDAVDQRIVNEVRTRTGRIIDHPDEVGGWPALAAGTPYPDADADGMSDLWEQAHGLDPADPSDRNGDLDGDGYTNLEEFLNQLAGDQVEGPGP